MIDNDRAEDRRSLDVKAIAHKLRHYPPFDRFRQPVTLKLASVGICEELERGIVLFREGDVSCNWYALLDGSIDVFVRVNIADGTLSSTNAKTNLESTTALVYTLTAGFAFGEEALNRERHCCTCIIRSKALLFRVERDNFRALYAHYADDFRPATIPIKDIVRDFCQTHNIPYGQHQHHHHQQQQQQQLQQHSLTRHRPTSSSSFASNYAPSYSSSSAAVMWPGSLTRKLSSGSASSGQQEPMNELKYSVGNALTAQPRQMSGVPPLTNGSSNSATNEPTTPQNNRWRYRKVTAPASIPPGMSPTSQQRVIHVVETHPTPDLLVNHVVAGGSVATGGDQQQATSRDKHMHQHAYDYSSQIVDVVNVPEMIGRPSALKSANTSGTTTKSGRNVVIATPSIMEQMAAKTASIHLGPAADHDMMQETVINGGGSGGNHENATASASAGAALPAILVDANQQMAVGSNLLMRANTSAVARGQQKNVIELSSGMSSEARLLWAGNVLRAVMFLRTPTMVRDRKYHLVSYKRCMVGTEMVDWLIQNSDGTVTGRMQAVGMWQSLLEEGCLAHVTHEYPFMDKHLLYRWTEDEGAPGVVVRIPTLDEQQQAQTEFASALSTLAHIGPDSLFRMVLRKAPQERTAEELEVVFEELLNIKALSHLSTMVKRELAAVMMFEQHHNAGTILFRQGDEGKSWYIILKGSVNVVIHAKGSVCILHEGDDFGKLALVNDAPRAATIILNEDNCQFLRVDKHDFNRILRDVEANTVRLKEHGRDVLVLEKIPIRTAPTASKVIVQSSSHMQIQHRYSVMAGTPEKMLEYLLETRIDCEKDDGLSDTFMDDFLLTHLIFMPTNILCNALSIYYQQGCSTPDRQRLQSAYDDTSMMAQTPDQFVVYRRRVVAFLHQWVSVAGYTFFQDSTGAAFVEEIYCAVLEDTKTHPVLSPELATMETLMGERDRAMNLSARRPHVILDCGILRDVPELSSPVLSFDTCVFKVYNGERAYVTLKARVDQPVTQLKRTAAQKLGMNTSEDDLGIDLVEVKSNGERIIYPSSEISVPSLLSLNGRLFACYKDQIDSLSPLAEQEGPSDSVHSATLELLGSSELSHQLLLNHWQLFANTHPYEFIYQSFGRDRFAGRVPTNLDLLVRRFNEVQFWVVTEVVLCTNISKRAALVKKFIKVAAYSKSLHDLLSFFAIVLGLSNVAVSRLGMTWDKVPTKVRKQFMEFESLLDPTRNHRAYRLLMSKLSSPIIPFVPLILKDLTFAHDGNKTYFDGLVNFEKMHMIAQTLRSVCFCKMRALSSELSMARGTQEAQQLVRNFKVIDDQKQLLYLSQKIEPRKQSC